MNFLPIPIGTDRSGNGVSLKVLEFEVHIRGPGDVVIDNCHIVLGIQGTAIGNVLVAELVGVSENRLGNKAARNCWQFRLEHFIREVGSSEDSLSDSVLLLFVAKLLIRPELAILDDWVTVGKVFFILILSEQLLVVS